MIVHLAISVWGPWHLDKWQRVMLPTLLAPGNLPTIANLCKLRLRLSTTVAEIPIIQSWPIFQSLSDLIEIEFVHEAENLDFIHHMEWIHAAIDQARQEGGICLWLLPDSAMNDGALLNV